MAQSLGRGLRAARRSGLTSPDPVRTLTAPTATPNPSPSPGTPDKPHNRRAAGRPRLQSPRKTPHAGIKPETSYRNWPVDRGLADTRRVTHESVVDDLDEAATALSRLP